MAYLSDVQKALERSKVSSDAWPSGTVLIGFTISPSGQVLMREVKKSSGSKVLDDAALAALDRAALVPADAARCCEWTAEAGGSRRVHNSLKGALASILS